MKALHESTLELMEPPTNYFVCTLGEASGKRACDHGIHTLCDLLDRQAIIRPDAFAVGFPVPVKGQAPWDYELLSKHSWNITSVLKPNVDMEP